MSLPPKFCLFLEKTVLLESLSVCTFWCVHKCHLNMAWRKNGLGIFAFGTFVTAVTMGYLMDAPQNMLLNSLVIGFGFLVYITLKMLLAVHFY